MPSGSEPKFGSAAGAPVSIAEILSPSCRKIFFNYFQKGIAYVKIYPDICIVIKTTNTMETNTITVRFKETYMPHAVERTCVNMTKQQVINVYGLNDPDIEWYEFID